MVGYLMDIARIADVAAGEAERQQTDFNGYVRLVEAYQFGYEFREDQITPNYVYSLAALIEPSKNTFGQYRRTPVTFANGEHAVDWNLVPTAMNQWFDMVNDPSDYAISLGPERMREYWLREFLRIHPFRDGHGRIAWIMRTRFYDQWASPDPLPKYFLGE
jgi:hypothetical protein